MVKPMSDGGFSAVRRWVGDCERWVRDLVRDAPNDDAIAAIVVMGSAIRDRGHRRSDVDLLVLYRGRRPDLHPPLEVDVRYQPLDEVESLSRNGNEIVTWALKFGLALYDPEQRWASLRSELAQELPLPSEEEARLRAERSLRVCSEMLAIGDEDAASDLILAVLTQLVRAELIHRGIFPGSRPELPAQLKASDPDSELASLLEDAMHSNRTARDLCGQLAALRVAA